MGSLVRRFSRRHLIVTTALVLGCTAALLPLCPPGIVAAADSPAARDWNLCPAIVKAETSHEIYALGDVHGDYKRLLKLLIAGNIIPAKPDSPADVKWQAGKAVFVCTGDLINKGDQSVNVLLFFKALRAAAERDGGRVIVTLGNHEAEFLANSSGDKVAEFAEELEAEGLKPVTVAAARDRLGLGQFLRSLPFAARVNDWFFAHAGNTRGRTLEQLRTELEEGVDAHGYRLDEVVKPLDALLNDRLHPFPWWQKSEDEDKDVSRDRLARNVAALGAKHLVVGHQNNKVTFSDGSHRKKGEMHEHFDGLLFLIDVGMSRAIDRSQGALLRIRRGDKVKVTVIDHDGAETKLWSE
jgi:hypothetical protein